MEVGIEDVNAYLAEGNTGMHFTASIKDTKLDPPTALTAITAIEDAGVEVVLGPQSSAEVAALKSYVDANGVLAGQPVEHRGLHSRFLNDKSSASPVGHTRSGRARRLMKADGMATIIPFWRNDAGNIGLQVATRELFSSVGTVKPGVQYAATHRTSLPPIASLKTQVQDAIAERGGTADVAVAHAGFDEVVDIFKPPRLIPCCRRFAGTALTAPR